MKNSTRQLLSALLLSMIFAACSRPIAYFQRGPVAHYNTPKTETVAAVTPTEAVQPAETVATAPVAVATPVPVEPVAQANVAMTQIEAYVRNDHKLATDKKLNQRMDRVKTMLASASTIETLTPSAKATRQMNAAERLMLKKIDKKISKQLAPNNPDKAMVNGGLLTGGIILVLAGLLLLILTSGTAATIGLIALLIGALALVLGLIAS